MKQIEARDGRFQTEMEDLLEVSQLPEWLEDAAPKEPVGKVQSIVQDLLIIQGGEDSKARKERNRAV